MKVRSVMQFVFVLVISFAQAGLVAAEPRSEDTPPAQAFGQVMEAGARSRTGLSAMEIAAWEAISQPYTALRTVPQRPPSPWANRG